MMVQRTLSSLRLVIFTSSSSPYAPLILKPVVERYHESIVAIVTIRGSSKRQLRSVIHKTGTRYAALKLLLFGSIRIHQKLGSYPSVRKLCADFRLPLVVMSSLRSPQAERALSELRGDLFLSVLFEKIFPPSIIGMPKAGALNFHPAPLPRYAGVAPIFWVLSNNESKTAVTLHFIDTGIDTGDVCLQQEVAIQEHDDVHSLYLRCCHAGSDVILRALDLLKHLSAPRMQLEQSRRTYFSLPTKEGYHSLRRSGHSLFRLNSLLAPLRARL